MYERPAGAEVVVSDAGEVSSRSLHSAALVAGWVALVLALLPFGVIAATKFEQAFTWLYLFPIYTVLVLRILVANLCVARGALAYAVAVTTVAVGAGVAILGYVAGPSITALVIEVALAAAARRNPGRPVAGSAV